MSKEQTPIEWLLSKLNLNDDAWIEIEKWEAKAKQKEKEHTKAKVLEALEKEFSKIPYIKHYNNGIVNTIGSKYYETKVKPKYE